MTGSDMQRVLGIYLPDVVAFRDTGPSFLKEDMGPPAEF